MKEFNIFQLSSAILDYMRSHQTSSSVYSCRFHQSVKIEKKLVENEKGIVRKFHTNSGDIQPSEKCKSDNRSAWSWHMSACEYYQEL